MTLSDKSWTLVLFVVTVISSAWWPTMPDWRWTLLGMITIGSIIKWRQGVICIGAILGAMVVVVHGNIMEHHKQALFQAGEDLTIIGTVDSPFTQISHGYEGIVSVSHADSKSLLPFAKPKIRLITPFPLSVNSHFTTQVSMKAITGLRNEAGFDIEQQSLGNAVLARAVVSSQARWIIRTHTSVRQSIIQSVNREIRHLHHFPLISALAFSDRTRLTHQHWQQLRDSGLLHLISISGLHIGMAYAFGASIGVCARYMASNLLYLPAVIGLIAAFSYAWLADFSLPTTRAFSVCAIYVMLKYFLVHWSAWRVLLLAVAIQLSMSPFAFFSMSFWLSYLSVAAVLLAVNEMQQGSKGRKQPLLALLKVQFLLTLLIMPISGYFFVGTSLASIFYNLVFIPWFGFVVVPVIFLALAVSSSLMTSSITYWFPGVLWQLLDWLLWPMTWALEFAQGSWQPLSVEQSSLVLLVCVLFILRRFFDRSAWMLLSGVVVMLTLPFSKERQGWRLDVLDVGHGLAVLIEKDSHIMLYDTGKAWAGGSIAEQVIRPVLHRRGYNSIDTLVLSHTDADHAGGRLYLESQFEPSRKLSSQKLLNYQPCVANNNWTWQGLMVEVVWPPKLVNRAYNPHSCVLRITDPQTHFRVLLTGDIEAISEWLLTRQAEKINSDVMLVPHHGSKSSSNPKFIHAVNPTLAIASLAKNNQWGMPAESVKAAYQSASVEWLDTGHDGQISVFINQDNWYFDTKRRESFEPWYRQMLRKGVE
ncbi:DNA internalization-related competence protein ComEC/Rec2 [Vibrio alfacsensis]|uniref:DNA internalization-related competence protein ComEC/Rec2 n=1 Tax=Vibrio alfacsensis TaxID=1074311 RepID=UPI001C812C4D|nr:DNA internalization-related competence protein ComEC/Rec2 [Vibrio alfacsensis]